MKVKELKKQLKGQYTDIIPINNAHRKALPFTQLGADLKDLTGRAFDKVFDEKEVVEYKLGEWKKTPVWSGKEMFTGVAHYENKRTLRIYFE